MLSVSGAGCSSAARRAATDGRDAAARAAPAFESRDARKDRAYEWIRAKNWKQAVQSLDALIDEEPGDMRLRMERGYARLALGERAAAADEFGLVAREPGEFQAQARSALREIGSEETPEARDARRDALLNQGYEDLRKGEKREARAKFKAALLEDPSRTEVVKQLGYMSMADGDLLDAVKELEGAHHLAPLDYVTALELGYIYDSLHDEAGAERSFAAALPSPDPKTRQAAASALKNIRGRTRPLYADVYAAPSYTSRFADKIATLEASAGYKPTAEGALSFYLGGRYTQDSRSRSGTAPEIYSDNSAWAGPGIRIQPKGFNASLTADWGISWNLMRATAHPRATEADGRVLLSDYHSWGTGGRGFADAGGSVGYYSRYRDDVIGYVQLRAGIKAWDDGSSQFSLYMPVNVYKDGNRDFYNNAAEVGVGAEFQPATKLSLRVRAEYLHGAYMGIEGRDRNPYGPHYDDVRMVLIYAGHFAMPSAAEDTNPTRRRRFTW